MVDHQFHGRKLGGRDGGELFCALTDRGFKFLERNRFIDQADVRRFSTRKGTAGQCILLCLGKSQAVDPHPRQVRSPHTGIRCADPGVLGCDDQISTEYCITGTTNTPSVDLDDDWLVGMPHAHKFLGRRNHFCPVLDQSPRPDALLYRGDEVPLDMNRLCTLRDSALKLPSSSVYIMDSGMAAILGATLDARVGACGPAIVLDVATSHTVAACFEGDELCSFVEYHTKDIRTERMDSLLKELADGQIQHQQILAEGGHGAYTRRALGFDSIEIILSTGPRRSMLAGSSHPIQLGAPLGDNMMTGTVGLLEAIRRREGWSEIPYD